MGTIGNLLRRVLLSDLGGVSITAIRIAGIKDEFSIITGVREDILEILLNLKGIVFRSKKQDCKYGRLKIEYGTGYKLVGQTLQDSSKDFLQIDAVFMPVQKVDFKIENVYENSDFVTERLLIDVWTNGSITPKDAIWEAAQFICTFFNSIIENKLTDSISDSTDDILSIPKDPYTNIAIEELQLSVRAYNCLKRAQINTIGDLLNYSPEKLQKLKNFGRKSADEVFMKLKNKLGIVLK